MESLTWELWEISDFNGAFEFQNSIKTRITLLTHFFVIFCHTIDCWSCMLLSIWVLSEGGEKLERCRVVDWNVSPINWNYNHFIIGISAKFCTKVEVKLCFKIGIYSLVDSICVKTFVYPGLTYLINNARIHFALKVSSFERLLYLFMNQSIKDADDEVSALSIFDREQRSKSGLKNCSVFELMMQYPHLLCYAYGIYL